MRTKVNKIFLMITILMLLFSVNTKVYAWGDIISDGDQFINEGKQGGVEIDTEDLQDLSGFLYNALLSAGVVIAVIVATVLGIQFMMGGAEGQAKVKEMLIPFVVGCIIVFGGFGIWKLALSIGNQLEPGTSQIDNNQTRNDKSKEGNNDANKAIQKLGETAKKAHDEKGTTKSTIKEWMITELNKELTEAKNKLKRYKIGEDNYYYWSGYKETISNCITYVDQYLGTLGII